jgi:PhzF family phenazine biosynthesis protein
MQIPLFHVNAFTTKPFGGNPAAVCPLSNWLDDGLLGKVAAENNLSETAFFVPGHGEGDYNLRWFTPTCEVRLCGHATLASAFVVMNLLQPKLQTVRFETRFSGVLQVSREENIFTMDFPATLSRPCQALPALIAALGPGPPPSQVLEGNET